MGLFWDTAKDKENAHKAKRAARFNQVIKLAKDIADINPKGLVSYVRLIAAPLQAKTITSAAENPAHGAREADTFMTLFFSLGTPLSREGKRMLDLIEGIESKRYRFRLGVDPLIATPWRRSDLARCLATIGEGKSQGAWTQDRSNHFVTALLPFGLGTVEGGNHSLATGIANGEGFVDTHQTFDLTPLYDLVHYDGIRFIRTYDGAELSQPQEEVPGMLFEIGRLMLQHGVAPGIERLS